MVRHRRPRAAQRQCKSLRLYYQLSHAMPHMARGQFLVLHLTPALMRSIASVKAREKDGHRGFMSGVRRISLVSGKKHKRTKSTATVADGDESQLPSIPQVPPLTMATTPSISSQLLPPIELQPPSPPRGQESDEPRRSIASERSVISTSGSLAAGVESLLLQPSVDATSSPPTITPRPSLSKNPSSPQAASLGRATQPPPATTATGIVPRRNSLGDLKIPARISQAQVGLKRDLGMVRDFAAEVES